MYLVPPLTHLLLMQEFGVAQFPKYTLWLSFGLGALTMPHTSACVLTVRKYYKLISYLNWLIILIIYYFKIIYHKWTTYVAHNNRSKPSWSYPCIQYTVFQMYNLFLSVDLWSYILYISYLFRWCKIKHLIFIYILELNFQINIYVLIILKLPVSPLLKVKERLLKYTLEISSKLFDLVNERNDAKIKM